MCGIAGAIAVAPDARHRAVVQAVVDSQIRRGPDAQAVEEVPGRALHVVLGHDRLSIIDLSAASNQPLWDRSGRYGLVFNGEIYNYVELRAELRAAGATFATEGDSEVILEAFKAWGPAAVERFNGMFAFAVLDRATEQVWLVRDRFGVKPLFYWSDGRTLYFGSTGGAIARRVGLPPCASYVARGLRYWVYEDDGDLAPYEGLEALPAGHVLHVAAGPGNRLVLARRRWYDLAARVAAQVEQFSVMRSADVVERVTGLLGDAIDLRLRADVPVGVSLSGGLDSSTIAAMLAERHGAVRGFTFGHPDDAGSEGPLVALLARKAGFEVEYVWPTPAELATALWDALDAQDAPMPGASIVGQYLVFKAARAAGVRVMLGGQGGDEAFMGYRKFMMLRLRRLAHERRFSEAAAFAASLLPLALAELPGARHYLAARYRYQDGPLLDVALRLPEAPRMDLGGDPRRPGRERQLLDVTRFSLPTLLRYEDRNSMGNSVESRLPFLDYRLLELGLALPEAMKLREGFGKWVLRGTAAGLVPDEIRLARYKRGFSVAQAAWIEGGLGEAIRARLRAQEAELAGWLARDARIDVAFSDQALVRRPTAFAEAMSLAWIGARASSTAARRAA